MEHGEVLDELKPLVSTPVLLSRVFATFIEVGGCSESKEDDASVELDPQACASRYPGHRDWHGRGKGGTPRGEGPNLECSRLSTYTLGDFEIYRGVERNSRRWQVFKS